MKNIVKNVEIFGFEAAMRGMRNPKNSWHMSDSKYENNNYIIGPNDMQLATTLVKAGGEHRKFLRMIHVQFDWYAPRYQWSEIDTYHFNTKNSTSTMHKLLAVNNPITLDMFDYCDEDVELMNVIVSKLEEIRKQYVKKECINKNELLIRAKALLPESFIQMRTFDTTYEELRNMYKQRKNHRLPQWREFCKFLETLPYAEEFIIN